MQAYDAVIQAELKAREEEEKAIQRNARKEEEKRIKMEKAAKSKEDKKAKKKLAAEAEKKRKGGSGGGSGGPGQPEEDGAEAGEGASAVKKSRRRPRLPTDDEAMRGAGHAGFVRPQDCNVTAQSQCSVEVHVMSIVNSLCLSLSSCVISLIRIAFLQVTSTLFGLKYDVANIAQIWSTMDDFLRDILDSCRAFSFQGKYPRSSEMD